MKNQVFIKKAVLSVMLLSAAISPVAAYAADGTSKIPTPKPGAASSVLTKVPGTYNFLSVDPVQLAKEYAPETVQDWTNVLKQLEEAGTPVLHFTLANAGDLKTADSVKATPALTAVPSIDVSKLDQKNIREGVVLKSTPIDPSVVLDKNATTAAASIDNAVSKVDISKLDQKDIREGVVLKSTPIDPSVVLNKNATTAAITGAASIDNAVSEVDFSKLDQKDIREGVVLKSTPIDPSVVLNKNATTAAKSKVNKSDAATPSSEGVNVALIQTSGELTKAVEAKDAGAIKASLSKLLGLYKDQLAG